MKQRISVTIAQSILKQVDLLVDSKKIKNRSHAIELLLSQSLAPQGLKIGLILAGGQGTRLRPITHEIPKPLIPVQGKPVILHNVEMMKRYGIKKIVLALGYKADKIKKALGNGSEYGVEFIYVEEKEPLGTAGPLLLAKEYLKDTFVVANCDELKDINLGDMYKAHKENNGIVTIALTTVEDPSNYGVARLQGTRIQEFIEKPNKETSPSKLINAGCYILEPSVIDTIPKGFCMLEKHVFPKLAEAGKVFGYPFTGQWLNTGTLDEYEHAIKGWKGFESPANFNKI